MDSCFRGNDVIVLCGMRCLVGLDGISIEFPRTRELWIPAFAGMTDGVDFRLLLPLPVYGRKSARLFELRRIFLRVMPLLPLRFQPEKQLAIIFLFQNVQ